MTGATLPHTGSITPGPHAELWLVDVAHDAPALEALEAARGLLSDAEIARAQEFKLDQERIRAWRAAHIALRLALMRFIGGSARRVPYDIEPAGKPVLPPPAPSFSLSHSAGFALIAVARGGEVGTDIEHVRARVMPPDRRQLIEQAALAIGGGEPLPEHGEDHFRLVQAWCRLEAAGKSDGRGVGAILSAAKGRASGVDVTRWSPSHEIASQGEAGIWRVWDIDLAGKVPMEATLASPQQCRATAAAAFAVARGAPGLWTAPPTLCCDLLAAVGEGAAAGAAHGASRS